MSEVRRQVIVSYPLEDFPAMDDLIAIVVGRRSDVSGAGCGSRDHGWECSSRSEATKIVSALRSIGLTPHAGS